nr:HEPN family nuclease [uncultured Rhodoferax sp.]
MEYESDFHRCFMERTQENLKNYQGNYEATQLINSLLGLLIVPKEKLFEKIPTTPLNELPPSEWGDVSKWVTQKIKCNLGHDHTLTLRQFVQKLRNSVAHFHIQPYPETGTVEGFEFADKPSFKAKIPVAELDRFVKQVASTLANSQ